MAEVETELETDSDLKLFVDALCIGCGEVTVATVPVDGTGWGNGSTFFQRCKFCREEQPHNIKRYLSALNRSREDAIPWDPDARAPVELETDGDGDE